jgi:hypothetical protein
MELCGLGAAEGMDLDGTSIVPLLYGRSKDWPDRVIVTDSQRIENPEKWRKSCVMTDRWRLIDGKELYDIKADPAQEVDAAANHPDVVAELRAQYERWWRDVSGRFDEYCEIVLGCERENPSLLTAHDWHGRPAWNQEHVRRAFPYNGFWAVRFARAGTYRITLRRWPRGIEAAMSEAFEGAKPMNVETARLKVAGFDATQDVPAGAKEAVFTARLAAGSARLQTWFAAADGESRGAYYVYVERL